MKRILKITEIFIPLVFSFITLNSCATTENYTKIVESWMGHDVNDLITSWGPPSDEYIMPNGKTMYTWLWVGGTLITSNYSSYLNMTFTTSTTSWCKTTFTVDKRGKIINWRWEGNACRAY